MKHALLFLLALAILSPLAAMAQEKAGQPKRGPLLLFNPANGHFYQTIFVPDGITWPDAKEEAAKRTYQGVHGYLATIRNDQTYQLITSQLFFADFWIGGYQAENDPRIKDGGGWRWVTGAPLDYVQWNNNNPTKGQTAPHYLSFWAGPKWSDHPLTDKCKGYVVEYPTPMPAPARRPPPTREAIAEYLKKTMQRYKDVKTYQATIEFTYKAFTDVEETAKCDLKLDTSGKLHLEGTGDNGRVWATSDGSRLLLAVIPPGERMKFDVKPMPSIDKALDQAFSLLFSSPRPPHLSAFLAATMDTKVWSQAGRIGELVDGEDPEQVIWADVHVLFPGEDPVEGSAALYLSLKDDLVVSSEMSYRYKAYPYSTKETHRAIKINEDIPGNLFVLVIYKDAVQVDDLGENDERQVEVESARSRP